MKTIEHATPAEPRIDDGLHRRVADLTADGRALWRAYLVGSDDTLLCRWDDDTKGAYDRLDDAFDRAHEVLADYPALMALVTAVYHAAHTFAARRERDGFADGYLLGRVGVTPALGTRLLDDLGVVATACAPAPTASTPPPTTTTVTTCTTDSRSHEP